MLLRQPLHFVEVDEVIVAPDAVLDRVEPLARLRWGSAVREMPARGEAEAHDRVARLEQREHHGSVGLRARMRLDVGEVAAEQLLRALDRQRLDRIRGCAALVIAAAGITFGIFVGEDRALGLQHRLADDVLGRDQLDLRLLAAKLRADGVLDGRVLLRQATGEETRRNSVVHVAVEVGGSSHQSLSFNCFESSSTRRWCRPPAKSVVRNASTHAFAMSVPISRPPIASTFASLCWRASSAESGSSTRAQRHSRLRLTAIDMPMPEPHIAMPRSDLPRATWDPSFAPYSG